MVKQILLTFLVTACLLSNSLHSAGAQNQKEVFCPVMPGTRIDPRFYVDYQGKQIFLCCRSCKKAFQKNPKKYLKRLE